MGREYDQHAEVLVVEQRAMQVRQGPQYPRPSGLRPVSRRLAEGKDGHT